MTVTTPPPPAVEIDDGVIEEARRRQQRRRAAMAWVLMAFVLVGAGVALGFGSGGGLRSPATHGHRPAYAAISASAQVLHEVLDTTTRPGPPPADCGKPKALRARINGKLQVVQVATESCNVRPTYERLEVWLLRADHRAHVIDRNWARGSANLVGEGIITSTGRAYWRVFSNGKPQRFMCRPYCSLGWNRLPRGSESAWLHEHFVSEFQSAYKTHQLIADGHGTFDGRQTARYRAISAYPTQLRVGPHGLSAPYGSAYRYTITEWYIDPAAARPLGDTIWQQCTRPNISSCTGGTVTQRLVTYQLLNPTPLNLAHLITPDAPAGAR